MKHRNRLPESGGIKFARPQIIWQGEWLSKRDGGAAEHVLDLEFKAAEHPKVWIGLLRWTLFVIAALLIYALVAVFKVNGEYLKSGLVRRGEAAAHQMQKGVDALKTLDAEEALRNFKLAEKNFTVALNEFEDLGQHHVLMAGLSLPRSELLQGQEILSSGKYLASAGVAATSAILPLLSYWSNLGKEGERVDHVGYEVGKLLLGNSKIINQAVADVGAATDTLSRISAIGLDPQYAALINEAKDNTQKFKKGVEVASILAARLPDALGFFHPRYYLLLNQNSNELRATGGFIGSYVLAEVYQGKLESIFVDTTQRLDGQNMNNSMELPEPLKAVTSYYGVRDANWEPNLPTSVRTIQKLYEQAGGGTVDGVITVNARVITDLLAAVGPIHVPEFGMTLDAENFVEKVQKHIEIDAQSDYNPKQLLVSFAPLFMDRLLNADEKELERVGQNLLRCLVNKDLMVYLTDSQLEGVVRTAGFSGEVWEIGGLDDYLYIVESNVGGNKSSEFLFREFAHRAAISNSGAVSDHLTLTYRHEGTGEFPDGASKNYVRIYLPAGTRVTRLTGYDAETQIDTSVSDGKTVIGFWLTIQPKSSSVVEVEYLLPFRIDLSSSPQYRLLVQRQSGLIQTHFISQVDLASELSFQEKKTERSLTWFSDALEQDQILARSLYRQ